jgi:hypothetical protein
LQLEKLKRKHSSFAEIAWRVQIIAYPIIQPSPLP